MATRKTKRGKTKAELKKLLKAAQAEVNRLLEHDENGTLTRRHLEAGLREVRGKLREIEPFEG